MWPPRNTAETIATRDTKEKKEAHQKKAKVKYEMISSQNDDFSFGFSHFKSLCVTFESLSLCVILSEGKESGVEFIVVSHFSGEIRLLRGPIHQGSRFPAVGGPTGV